MRLPRSRPGVVELRCLPAPTPPVVSPSWQFGLDLLAQALLGGLVEESCHFRGWPGAARCWEWTQGVGWYCRNPGSRRGVGRDRWPRLTGLQVGGQASQTSQEERLRVSLSVSATVPPPLEWRDSACQAPRQYRWVGVYVSLRGWVGGDLRCQG